MSSKVGAAGNVGKEGFTTKWRNPVTIKTLTIIAVVSASLASPVLARQARVQSDRNPTYDLRHFRSTYNQVPTSGPWYVAPRIRGGFGVEGFASDPSQVGGVDPSLRPSGS